jgi:thiol-disulfide isomerase/thioredoxin
MPNYYASEGGNLSGFFSTVGGATSSTNYMLIIGLCVLFAIVAFCIYIYVIKPSFQTTYKSNSEQVPRGEKGGNEVELMFFYADWCPHCKVAKPAWNDVKAEYENKTINGYTVIFIDVDCSDENSTEVQRMMDQYTIEGFPTIKLLKDGQVIDFDAKPTKDSLTQFLNTVLK